MKILSVNIGATSVVLEKSMWTGKEWIYANGILVSEQFTWFGTAHYFEVEENGVLAKYTLATDYGWCNVTKRLSRNGVMIVDFSYNSSSFMF